MCRLVGWVSSSPVTAAEVLGEAGVERLLHLSEAHCDGWGAAWPSGTGVEVRRSTVQASKDPQFRELLFSMPMSAAILHLRMGTPGYGRGVTENHPFTDGVYAFAHNGAVLPPEGIDALIAPGSLRRPVGRTDSERIFLALLDEFDAAPSDGDLATAVAVVVERARRAGLHASSWNSMLLGPRGLSVVCYHDTEWVAKDVQLWPTAHPPAAVSWPPYFDLRLRDRGDGIRVVTSSGIVDDVTGWDLLPNHSVLELTVDGRDLVPVPPGLGDRAVAQ